MRRKFSLTELNLARTLFSETWLGAPLGGLRKQLGESETVETQNELFNTHPIPLAADASVRRSAPDDLSLFVTEGTQEASDGGRNCAIKMMYLPTKVRPKVNIEEDSKYGNG